MSSHIILFKMSLTLLLRIIFWSRYNVDPFFPKWIPFNLIKKKSDYGFNTSLLKLFVEHPNEWNERFKDKLALVLFLTKVWSVRGKGRPEWVAVTQSIWKPKEWYRLRPVAIGRENFICFAMVHIFTYLKNVNIDWTVLLPQRAKLLT